MHPLLLRQLKRHLNVADLSELCPQVAVFAGAVDEAYAAADLDRQLLEHSLNLAAVELHERFQQLQQDVEVRKKAEAERDTFFQMSNDLLCITDLEGRLRQVNPTWTRVLGHRSSEVLGMELWQFADPQNGEGVRWRLPEAAWKSHQGEVRMRCKSGEWRDILWSATCDPVSGAVFAIGRDVTGASQRAIEASQAQKLQAVGQLAAGVAHEINTPIQYVGDNADFLRQGFDELRPLLEAISTLPPGGPLEPIARGIELGWLLEEIPRAIDGTRDGISRIAELVRALKDFAHPDSDQKTLIDLNHALTGTLTVARNELKYVADVSVELGVLPPVLCHGGALNQVFLNLLVNAAHAIGDRGPGVRGTIKVSTRADLEEIVIAVCDSGVGIPDTIRHRIFEPFFTTKGVGRGTGQGLALARAIVEKHGGHLTFESILDRGTTFFVRLPLVDALPRAS